MTVAKICCRDVDSALREETVLVAAQRMLQRNVGTLIVVDGHRHPVGILTDRDIVLRVVAQGLAPQSVPVADVMTEEPRTIHDDSSIERCLGIMRSAAVRRLPVVDTHGVLCGVVSLDDVLAHLAKEAQMIGTLLHREGPHALRKG